MTQDPIAVEDPSGFATTSGGHRLQVLRSLGSGGFGDVYLARMFGAGGVNQHVAIKILRADIGPDDQAVERLRDEARLLATLRHPVVLAAHDLVTVDGRTAMIVEYVEGQDLTECIDDPHDAIPVGPLLDVVEQVSSALDMAFRELQVVHRDIKPQNIRIGIHGNVKLLDFGIARSDLVSRSARTQSMMLMGTIHYLAPERFELDLSVSPPSDVFSLGCVLYEGVTHEPLFAELQFPQLCRLSGEPEQWREFIAGRLELPMHPEVRILLQHMLSFDPEDRPTAAEVALTCETIRVRWASDISLRAWSRKRQWPTTFVEGHNDLEGSLSPANPRPEGPSRRAWVAALALAGLLGIVGLGGLATAGMLLLGLLGRDDAGVAVVPSTDADPFPLTAPWDPDEDQADPGTLAEDPTPPPVDPVPVEPAPAAAPRGRSDPTIPRPEPRSGAAGGPSPDTTDPTPDAGTPDAGTPDAEGSDPTPTAVEEAAAAGPLLRVTITSIPLGADIVLLGESEQPLGRTPRVHELPVGRHRIRLTASDGTVSFHEIQVRQTAPSRYVWHSAENRWESGY